MILQFDYPHSEHGDIDVTITHYLEDTQHLEGGSPMEIVFRVLDMLDNDISYKFSGTEVETMLKASCERVRGVFDEY